PIDRFVAYAGEWRAARTAPPAGWRSSCATFGGMLPPDPVSANALADAATGAPIPSPPVPLKRPKVDVVHGQTRTDDYVWMRDKANPEVAAYLEAENAYADAVMKPSEAFQQKLYDEMLARIQETDVNVPYRQGAYFYYSRTEAGKQYPIFCRKKD